MIGLELGSQIRELRRAAHLSQSALASRVGIDATYLSKLENSRQGASSRVLTALAEALNVDPARLLVLAGRLPEGARFALMAQPGAGALPAPIPHYPTRFVGRDDELDQLTRLVRLGALVTVSGPPGCGKTRLLAEVARAKAEAGARVVWIRLRDGDDVARLDAQLAGGWGDGGALLFLDDADLALSAAAELTGRLLTAGRDVGLIVSSRQPLGVYGEQLLRLAGLPNPNEDLGKVDEDQDPNPVLERLRRHDAVFLFQDRAAMADPDFVLTAENARAVAKVCAQLDGMPLALELAALRLRQMTVADLADRVEDLFTWLAGNTADVPARHASLADAIGWSFERLSVEQQTAAARLSVIAGPFDLEAARLVAADAPLPADRVAEVVLELVDRSMLVRQTDCEGRATYRWPRTVRQFCLRVLEAWPDAEDTWRRYVDWWCREIGSLEGDRRSSKAEWARLVESLQDWLAAVDRVRAQSRREALNQVAEVWPILMFDRWEVVERLAEQSEGSGLERARALRTAGILARVKGDFQKADELCSAAHRIFVELDDATGRANTLLDLAENSADRGDLRSAEANLAAAGSIYEALGDESGIVDVKNAFGMLKLKREPPDWAGADRLFQDALVLAERLEEPRLIAYSLHNLAISKCLRGWIVAARGPLRKSLAIRQAIKNRRGVAKVLETFALLESRAGEHPVALRLLGAARQYRRSTETAIPDWWKGLLRGVEETAAGAIGPAEVKKNLDRGAATSLEEAAQLATREMPVALPAKLDSLVRSPLQRPLDVPAEIAGPHAAELLDEQGTGLQPQDALLTAWQLHQLGDMDAARELYERVIASGDSVAAPEALRNLGLVLEKQGQFDDALRAYQRAVDSGHPDVSPRAGVNLGWLHAHLGQPEAARRAYECVIGTGSLDHALNARINLAKLLDTQGRPHEARRLLDEVIRSGHTDHALHAKRHLAHLLQRQGQLTEAWRLLEAARQSPDPRQAAKAEIELADLQTRLGHADEATHDWRPATPLEQAIWRNAEGAGSAAEVRQSFAGTELLALGEAMGARSGRGRSTAHDLLCFAAGEGGGRAVVIPVFTRAAWLVPALQRNPDWRSRSVLTVDGARLLANLAPGEIVVVDPWTPLEFRLPAAVEGDAAPLR